MSGPVLVADIGGTNARFARYGGGTLTDLETWPTVDVPTLAQGIRRFLELHPGPVAASCAAVAGPVLGPEAFLTNTPWRGSVRDLPGRGRLVNDLQAAAAAIPALDASDCEVIHAGVVSPDAPRAVLGLGTGLGEALAVGDTVIPGEGGHKTFGPADEQQRALGAWLARLLGRAPSWEDVLSGDGLGRCLAFLRHPGAPPPGLDVSALAHEATGCPDALLTREAVALYARCCAVEARNVGLQVLARGGVWLVGGMPARISDDVWREAFSTHFALTGPMASQAAGTPVLRVRHDAVNLLGAAVLAGR